MPDVQAAKKTGYYRGLKYWGYIGLMDKKMETTICITIVILGSRLPQIGVPVLAKGYDARLRLGWRQMASASTRAVLQRACSTLAKTYACPSCFLRSEEGTSGVLRRRGPSCFPHTDAPYVVVSHNKETSLT